MDYEQWAEQYRRLGYPEGSIRARWSELNPGALSLLGRGLASGLVQMAESVGSGLKFLGADELGGSVQDYWAKVGEQYAPPPSIQGSIVDQPDLMASPGWWAYNLGQMAPFTASMFVPGIAAARGAQAIGAAAKGAGLASRIGGASRGIGTAVGAGTGGFFEAMPEYEQSLQDGMDPVEARLRAGATGLAIGALNTIPLSRAFGPGGLVKRALTTGASEAATEWAEEPTTAAIYGRDIGEAAYQGVNVIPPAFVMGMLGAGGTPKDVRKRAVTLPDDSPLLRETIDIPGRDEMRARIVDEIVSRGTPKDTPTAYVFGGGGAAGKGTIREALTEMGAIDRDAVLIDPDEVKQKIPEYQAIASLGDPRAAITVHEESSVISSDALSKAIDQRKDVVIDETLGNPQKAVELLRSLREAGYKTELVGVTVDPQEALRRAAERGERTGRYVDPDALVSAHGGFASGFETYATLVDSAALYDTSTAEPTKIAEADGGRVNVIDSDRYNKFKEVANEGQAASGAAHSGAPAETAGQDSILGDQEGYQAPGQKTEGKAPGNIPDAGLTAWSQSYRGGTSGDVTGEPGSQDNYPPTSTPEFKEWSGGAPVVRLSDTKAARFESGSPVVIEALHGTDADIESFSQESLGFNTGAKSAKEGFFFTNSPDAAELYPVYEKGQLLESGGFLPYIDKKTGKKIVPENVHDKYKKAKNKRQSLFNSLADAEDAGKINISEAEANAIKAIESGEYSDAEIKAAIDLISESKNSTVKAYASAASEYANALDTLLKYKYKYQFSSRAWEGGDALDQWDAKKKTLQPNIMPVYLSMKNPMVYDYKGASYRDTSYSDLIEKAKKEGFDGLILKNTRDPVAMDVYVVFSPTQIKSKFNRGSFSTEDQRILYSKQGRISAYGSRDAATLQVEEERRGSPVVQIGDGRVSASHGHGSISISSPQKGVLVMAVPSDVSITETRRKRELGDMFESILVDRSANITNILASKQMLEQYPGLGVVIDRLGRNGALTIDASNPYGVLYINVNRKSSGEIYEPFKKSKDKAALSKISSDLFGKVAGAGSKIGLNSSNPGKYVDTFDFESEFYSAGMSPFSVTPPSADSAGVLAGALDDLVAEGMPKEWRSAINGLGDLSADYTEHGVYVFSWKKIGINKNLLEAAANSPSDTLHRLVRTTVAHEIGHAVDIGVGAQASSSSMLLDINPARVYAGGKYKDGALGPVMKELFDYWASEVSVQDGLHNFLNYPMQWMLDIGNSYDLKRSEELAKRLRAEAFAQLTALRYNYPELMRRRLPAGYKLVEEVAHASTEKRLGDFQGENGIRKAFRTSGPPDGAATGGPAGGFAAGVEQREPGGGVGEMGVSAWFSRQGGHKPGGSKGFAGNLNLDKYGRLTPMAEEVLTETYNALQRKMEKARRNTIPWDETVRLASDLGMNPSDLAKRAKGTALNAEQLERSRQIVEESALATAEAARRAEESGSPDDMVKAYDMLLQHAALQEKLTGAVAEAGRALNILRKVTSESKAAKQIIESDSTIEEKVAMMAGLTDPGQVSKFAREASKTSTSDILLEVWINALLSGPQTHVVNILSNTLVDAFSLAENAVAAVIGKMRKGNKVTFRETMARAVGMMRGGLEGARLAKEAFITEETTGQNKVEARRYQAIAPEAFGVDPNTPQGKAITKIGRTVRIPGRALGAMDEYFKAVARRSAVAGLAVRKAYSEGLTGEAWTNRVKELTTSPTDEMLEQAGKEAEYMTFTNRLGPFGRALQRMATEIPALRLIIPFIRTPTNIVKFAAHRSPLMLASKSWWRTLKTATGAERDIMLARMLTGTALMAGIAALTAAGKITGGGPDDPRERELLRRTGWQPYSVWDGGQWVAYSRLEPLGMLFGIAADLQEISSDDDVENVASMLVASMAKNIASKTWLRGVSEAVMALSDPDRYGDRWWINLMGTAVPTGVAHVARVQDQILRDARTVTDRLLSRIPGQTDRVMPRRDTRGEVIRLEGGIGPDILSPIYASSPKDDPVAEELLRVGVMISKPSRRVFKTKLSPDEYDIYQREAGALIESLLRKIIDSPGYKRLSDEYKKAILERVITKARQRARFALIRQRPEILSGDRRRAG